MLTLYGIRNCDTVKKARAWLDGAGVGYRFHDYKTDGVDAEQLARCVERLGWEIVLNRGGTTFRRLPEAKRVDLDAGRAISLMLSSPSAIRRPIVEGDDLLLVGFTPAAWREKGLGR